MRYIIDVPEGIHKKVVHLIAKGDYATMQDFALIALQNQLLIEDASASDSEDRSNLRIADFSPMKTDEVNWKLSAIRAEVVVTATSTNDNITTDWIFGQVNRVLPIKFGIRMLIVFLQDSGESLVLDWFREKAAEKARKFGKILEQHDEDSDRKRDERLSVGFPTGQLAKSLRRYGSHFLGYQQPTTGRSVGALPELGFAVIAEEQGGGYSIGITESGLRFGLLPNPAIDNDTGNETMSYEEAIFYVEHVCERAPGEAKALGLILGMIAEGIDRPEGMDEKMTHIFPNWSSSLRGTNRSGAIGRAADLGLLLKDRFGSGVQYKLSELGSQMLSVINNHKVVNGG
jgi:hypothetical protein